MPNLAIMDTHPVAWVNPVDMRASAALPAAGAWDAAATEQNVAGARWMLISFTYTRGAAGGAVDWQLETSIYSIVGNVPAGAGEWQNETARAVGAVALGADTQSEIQQNYSTYGSQGAAAETFTVGPFELGYVVERIRIPARESADGDVQAPGDLQITIELW